MLIQMVVYVQVSKTVYFVMIGLVRENVILMPHLCIIVVEKHVVFVLVTHIMLFRNLHSQAL